MKIENKKFSQLLAAQIVSVFGTWLSVSGLVAYFRINQGISDLQVGIIYVGPYFTTFVFAAFLGSLANRLEARKAAVFCNWLLAAWTGSYCLFWASMGAEKLIWPMVSMIIIGKLPQLVTEPAFTRLFQQLAGTKAIAASQETVSGLWTVPILTDWDSQELLFKFNRLQAKKLCEKSYDSSIGLNSAALQVSTLAGVAVGPLLCASLGAQAVFLADCCTYVAAALLLTFLAVRVLPEQQSENSTVRAAVKYMHRTGRIGLTITAFGAFTLWGAKDTLAPAIVGSVGYPVEMFGVYHITSTAAELLITGLVATGLVSIAKGRLKLYALAFAVTPIVTAFCIWSGIPATIFAGKFFEGLLGNLLAVSLQASIFLKADPAFSGTVTGIYQSSTRGWQTAAYLLPGYFSTLYGPARTMVGVGIVMFTLTLLGWIYNWLFVNAD